MMNKQYTREEEAILLRIARETLERATAGEALPLPDLTTLPEALREPRACFVTLHTVTGELRGCTGTLVARQPLAHEVSHIARQTAFNDPRFPPLRADELPNIVIEISVLTPPVELAFDTPQSIPRLLRPYIDGVILVIGAHRATFLPQVWERASDPEEFLDLLCRKMGLPPGLWNQPDVQVFTYQTVVIEEQSERV